MEPHHAKELPYIQVHTAQCHSSTSHSSLIFPDSCKTTKTKKKKKKTYLNSSGLDNTLKTCH